MKENETGMIKGEYIETTDPFPCSLVKTSRMCVLTIATGHLKPDQLVGPLSLLRISYWANSWS